jgi:hypothetical protein
VPKVILPVTGGDFEDLHKSGLFHSTILNNKLRTVNDAETLAKLLNQLPEHPPKEIPEFCRSGGLVFPYFDLEGKDTGFVRVKPHEPRLRKGKPAKYEQPLGEPNRAYFPASSRQALRDGAGPIFVTEGEKKALALAQLGLATIGLGGVWNWTNGGDELTDDLKAVSWEERPVYIVFDHDPKPDTVLQVGQAANRLAARLVLANVDSVYMVALPGGPDGAKQGVDDFLLDNGVRGNHGLALAAFRVLMDEAKRLVGRVRVLISTDEYRVNAEAEAVLAAQAKGLYQRGHQLFQVQEHDPRQHKDEYVRRPERTPLIRPLPPAILREELSRHVRFVERKRGEEGQTKGTNAHPPPWTVSAIASRGIWPSLPHLEGVYSHPVLLPDGTLLAQPGHDRNSGLLLHLPDGLGSYDRLRVSLSRLRFSVHPATLAVLLRPRDDNSHEAPHSSIVKLGSKILDTSRQSLLLYKAVNKSSRGTELVVAPAQLG